MDIQILPDVHLDIKEIKAYISQDSPRYGKETAENIYKKINQLSFYNLGRITPELQNPNYRELIYNKRYRILYYCMGNMAIVYAVRHSSRRFSKFNNTYLNFNF